MFEQKPGQRVKRKESKIDRAVRGYEYSILEKREIPTRAANLHDFFNAIVWFNFPKAKYHLHRRAYEVQTAWSAEFPGQGRCPLADRLTCFDEGGIVWDLPEGLGRDAVESLVQSRDDEGKRALVQRHAGSFALFGHGMMEVMLKGGSNIYASCIIVDPGPGSLDERLASYLEGFDARRPAHGGINISWLVET